MTAPRVTVPVDPIQRLILAADSYGVRYLDSDDMSAEAEELQAATEAMKDLIAAPAPEGGAVRYRHKKRGTEYTLIGVGRAQGELQDDDPVVLYRGDDGGLWVRHQVEFCDGRFEQVSALATREEAPAEAGELVGLIDYLENMRAETVTDEMREIMSEWINAIRAQPPAREDAQPVAWSFELATARDRETGEYSSWGEPRLSFTKPCVPEGSIRNLTALGPITHPAPDALRVAAKKLAFMARTSGGTMGPDRDLMSACDAVEAILQAKQKGGAS